MFSHISLSDPQKFSQVGHWPSEKDADSQPPGSRVRAIGSMVNGSMSYFTDPYKWGMNWGYNPLILTIY